MAKQSKKKDEIVALSLRMPISWHKKLRLVAISEKRSVNQQALIYLEEKLA